MGDGHERLASSPPLAFRWAKRGHDLDAKARGGGALVVVAALLTGVAAAASGGSQWNSAGGDLENTRFQANKKTLSVTTSPGSK